MGPCLRRVTTRGRRRLRADRVDRLANADALGIESDDVVNYCFPTTWPTDRDRRARYIGEWLKTEARYLA
jgi:hypothetical protein